MKFLRSKRTASLLLGAVVVLASAFVFWQNSQPWIPEGWSAPLTPPPAHAAPIGDPLPLTGWAWSSNIGWVSFNSADPGSPIVYSVVITRDIDPVLDGKLSGYAWSNNIGWIDFTPTDNPPGSLVPMPAKLVNGTLTGWARAIAGKLPASAGWDGWIKLSDTTAPAYGVTFAPSGTDRLDASGFAWGSTVVGWLSMNPSLSTSTACPAGGVCIPGGGGGGSYTCSPSATGNDVTWSVAPSSGPSMRYQWKKDSAPISGATNSTYTISNIIPGTYNINVTLTDGVTGVISNTSLCPYTKVGTHTLTVNVVRNDGTVGTIVSTPGSISCGSACGPVAVADSTSVTLSAAADLTPGATISCAGPGISSCTFLMPAQDTSVTVTISVPAASCPASIKCFINGLPCNAGPTSEVILDADNTSISSPAAKIVAVAGDGVTPISDGYSLALHFSQPTITHTGTDCVSGRTIIANHRLSVSSTMYPYISRTNDISYDVISTDGEIFYKAELHDSDPATDPLGGDGYKCLNSGDMPISVTITKGPSCPAVTIPGAITLKYQISQTTQKSTASSIQITLPNSSTVWPQEIRREDIEWNAADVPSGASLTASLVSPSGSILHSESIDRNSGSYQFPYLSIPLVPPGTGYRIRIKATVNGSLVAQGESASFTVQ